MASRGATMVAWSIGCSTHLLPQLVELVRHGVATHAKLLLLRALQGASKNCLKSIKSKRAKKGAFQKRDWPVLATMATRTRSAVLAAVAVAVANATPDLGAMLSALDFRNNGTVTSEDVFVLTPQNSG